MKKNGVNKKSYNPRAEITEKEKKLGELKFDPERGKYYYGKPLSGLFPPVTLEDKNGATEESEVISQRI